MTVEMRTVITYENDVALPDHIDPTLVDEILRRRAHQVESQLRRIICGNPAPPSVMARYFKWGSV